MAVFFQCAADKGRGTGLLDHLPPQCERGSAGFFPPCEEAAVGFVLVPFRVDGVQPVPKWPVDLKIKLLFYPVGVSAPAAAVARFFARLASAPQAF